LKSEINQLAFFGGPAAFREPLHVGTPNIGDRKRFLARVGEILDRRWLTNHGRCVQEFEQRVADLLGVKHCLAICNGTIALEIAVRALGLSGEVIVPSMTFIATAHALRLNGVKPVFCDVSPDTMNLDPQRVMALITPRTSGILGVHLWGRPCEIDVLSEIAGEHRLALFFDAAHAFGCSYKGKMIGRFGRLEVFSFHATKFFNTIEGGAITTDDDELADKIRLMRNFGFLDYDLVVELGTNGKLSEISAAMGLNLLDCLEDLVADNYRNYKVYEKELSGCPGIELLKYGEEEQCNYQYVILKVDEEEAGLSRDQLVHLLWAENVLARRYFFPGCHRMEPYASEYANCPPDLPVTEDLVNRLLALPSGTSLGKKTIGRICGIIRFLLENGAAVREEFARTGDLGMDPAAYAVPPPPVSRQVD
jgi:dTDP-4-amino-4,6-dideoxygalactose transaminase